MTGNKIIRGAEKVETVTDDDWQALMGLASALRAKATARYADDIARAEIMEERAHEIAKQSGDLGYLS